MSVAAPAEPTIAPAWRDLFTRRHGVPALISALLHTALLLCAGWMSVRPPPSSTPPVRVTIIETRARSGSSPARVPASALPIQGPPRPAVHDAVVEPARPPHLKNPRPAVRSRRRPSRIIPPPTARESAAAAETLAAATTVAIPGSGTNTAKGTGNGNGMGAGTGGGGAGSAEDELARYLALIRQRIESAKRYPLRARRAGLEGRVVVAFEIDRQGVPQRIVVRSADHRLLADAAVEAIRGATPFPARATSSSANELQIEVPLNFSLRKDAVHG